MKNNTVSITGGLASVALVVLTLHASRTNAFDEPATFVGMVVGIVLISAAWALGKRRSARTEN